MRQDAFSAQGHDPFAAEREDMVRRQLVARGIADPRVLDAMRHVPRHLFVSPEQRASAYADRPLPIGIEQTISQPYMVAIMTELLDLDPSGLLLEVGTGSGYQAAVAARLVREVVTIERHPALAYTARATLERLGVGNVTVLCGDGTLGAPDRAPFDAILVTAAAPDVPAPLTSQLAEGGRLVCPVGSRISQRLIKITRTRGEFAVETSIACVFVPLVGLAAWEES